MISFDEALAIVEAHRWQPAACRLPLAEAAGRRLSKAFVARYDSPRFTNSAMDGYAVGSPEGPWEVVGVAAAGSAPQPIQPNQAVRIFTGAPVPGGAYAVIAQEDVERTGNDLRGDAPKQGAHFRYQGEEFAHGTELLRKGARITPAFDSVLASQGVSEVEVQSLPRVAILATGTELLGPKDEPRDGAIFESNSLAVAALLRQFGCTVTTAKVADSPEATESAMSDLLAEHDLLLTIGGVSVGDFDFVRPAAERAGLITHFSGVAIRPGKPVTFGTTPEGKAWFGLPGNPMSALVTCSLFVLSYLGEGLRFAPYRLAEGHSRRPGREEFVPAHREGCLVSLAPTIGSHAVGGLTVANGLCRIPGPRTDIKKGDEILFADLPWGARL